MVPQRHYQDEIFGIGFVDERASARGSSALHAEHDGVLRQAVETKDYRRRRVTVVSRWHVYFVLPREALLPGNPGNVGDKSADRCRPDNRQRYSTRANEHGKKVRSLLVKCGTLQG